MKLKKSCYLKGSIEKNKWKIYCRQKIYFIQVYVGKILSKGYIIRITIFKGLKCI